MRTLTSPPCLLWHWVGPWGTLLTDPYKFHEISETLCTTIHDILPQRFHAIQYDLIRELFYWQGNGNPQVDQYINRVQESFANTNYFVHPSMIPCTKKRDNNNIVMMSPTVPNLQIFILLPIAKTQDSASSNSSQPRTTVKVKSSTPQQSNDLQFKVDHWWGDKSKLASWVCPLSETRVTGTNQRTVVSKMGHSCVQTSRHWGGN